MEIFFIDQDAQVFGILLKYLRQCDQQKGVDTKIPRPKPTFDFCTMLEYYDLMSSIYPQKWRSVLDDDDFTAIPNKDDSLTISTGNSVQAITLELQKDCSTKPINARSFTATFEQGSTGQIGWAAGLRDGRKLGQDEYNVSFAFDLDSSRFMGNRSSVGNGQEWSRTMPVEIRCTYNVSTYAYSIHVVGRETDPVVMATFEHGNRLYPYINFSGKVTISNVSYVY